MLTKPAYPGNLRDVFYPRLLSWFKRHGLRIVFGTVSLTIFLCSIQIVAVYGQARAYTIVQEERLQLTLSDLKEIGELKSYQERILPRLAKIDQELAGPSTTEMELLLNEFDTLVSIGNYEGAHKLIDELSDLADVVLGHQKEIARAEISRLAKSLSNNLEEIGNILGDKSIVPDNATEQLESGKKGVLTRYELGKKWVGATSREIKRRRAEIDEAQKQIVIKKSELKLYMYENGKEKYSMPISLGRPGAGTRSGDFAVLDKLGTVWSFWEIWLPYWMGIYFAGSSENGIHGLPFNNAGTVYWRDSIGRANVTYGCVMPDDPDMVKLYEWSEVGVPVTIVQ